MNRKNIKKPLTWYWYSIIQNIKDILILIGLIITFIIPGFVLYFAGFYLINTMSSVDIQVICKLIYGCVVFIPSLILGSILSDIYLESI